MSNFKSTCLALCLCASAFSVGAAELVLTASDANAKSSSGYLALDIATDGNVSGFNFVVKMPAGTKLGMADLSNCLADLPKGFSGDCRQGPEGIYVFAMANDKRTLPSGVISVGRVALPAALAKSDLVIDQLVFADADGEVIESSHQVAR
jgi:hypothetical protein